jgi:hypothetical protein
MAWYLVNHRVNFTSLDASYEALSDKVLWVVTPLPPSSGWNEDGGSLDLRNVGILPQQCTLSQSSWTSLYLRVTYEIGYHFDVGSWNRRTSEYSSRCLFITRKISRSGYFTERFTFNMNIISDYLFYLFVWTCVKFSASGWRTDLSTRMRSIFGICSEQGSARKCFCFENFIFL